MCQQLSSDLGITIAMLSPLSTRFTFADFVICILPETTNSLRNLNVAISS